VLARQRRCDSRRAVGGARGLRSPGRTLADVAANVIIAVVGALAIARFRYVVTR
jgi:hypothetical protein